MSALQQIRWNAAWVAENIGKQSGIEPFAYTAESVRYLEQFLVRQEALVKASGLSVNKYVHLLGGVPGRVHHRQLRRRVAGVAGGGHLHPGQDSGALAPAVRQGL